MNQLNNKKTKSTGSALDSGRRVLSHEAKALSRMADELGNTFNLAIDIFEKITGKIVVSGMGKSGHIAKKISATFSSTGAPAVFVHPAEASHGDLGMITKDDALLVISNSGETEELSHIVEYSKRFEIPLVGIIGKSKSLLSDAVDIALILPDESEAGTLGLAPTTSTTMALAMGDAIAVALFERRNFTSEDFKIFHPGGKLGRKLVRVSEIMHVGDSLPVVKPETPMSEALLAITQKSFGCVAIISGQNKLLGVITDGDLRRHMSNELLQLTAEDVMTQNPQTIRPNALAAEALAIMNENQITSLLVLKSDQLQGIVHIHDCLRAGVA